MKVVVVNSEKAKEDQKKRFQAWQKALNGNKTEERLSAYAEELKQKKED